jgi:5'-nucleotidase
MVNAGGIRASLPAGPLTYGTVYEMFPFDNRFASIRVKAEVVRKLVRGNLLGADGFSIAGVRVQATCKGSDLHVDLLRGGRPLRDNEEVVLLISDYMAMTSRVNDAGMPREAFVYEPDPPIREAIVEHLRSRGASAASTKPSPFVIPSGWPVVCPGPRAAAR